MARGPINYKSLDTPDNQEQLSTINETQKTTPQTCNILLN